MQNCNVSRVNLSGFTRAAHRVTIERLTHMINNWDDLANYKVVKVDPEHKHSAYSFATYQFGLCTNAIIMPCPHLKQIILDWRELQGLTTKSEGLLTPYWLGGKVEFNSCNNLYKNLKRLHAAIYIRNRLIDLLAEDLK